VKYLFIGSHADDVELSCGGTVAKLSEEGHNVTMCAMSCCGRPDLIDECSSSSKILGVHLLLNNFRVRRFSEERQKIADYFYSMRDDYDTVFTHSSEDRHPDHRTIGEESLRVFTGNLFTYIAPWNGEENANYFVELSPGQLQKKLEAIQCYKSQTHRKYMNPDFIRSWAIYNGIKAGYEYAEAFRLVKGINFADICGGFSNHTLRNVAQSLEGDIRYQKPG
jgi:N-acetylglucosamine malate deacetylase 1